MTLSEKDKREALARIYARIGEPVPSPYLSRFRFPYAFAVLFVAVVISGTAVQAAEGSLPGSPLYPLKLYVTEPARSALAVGAVSKARFEAERASRRLAEAETLVARGQLDEKTAHELAEQFTRGARAFDAFAERSLAEAPVEELVNARIDFEAQVNAHASILSSVRESVPYRDPVAPLARAVADEMVRARSERALTVEAVLAGDTDDSGKRSERGEAGRLFDKKIRDVRASISAAQTNLALATTSGATTTVPSRILQSVPGKLLEAEASMRDAESSRESGDDEAALSALLDSESAVREAGITAQQGMKFAEEEKHSKRNRDRKPEQDLRGLSDPSRTETPAGR